MHAVAVINCASLNKIYSIAIAYLNLVCPISHGRVNVTSDVV